MLKKFNKKSILFFTTNSIWGGSEVLWTQSAKKLLAQNFDIKAIARYDFKFLSSFIKNESRFFDLSTMFVKLPLWKSVLNKLASQNFSPEDKLEKFLKNWKFDLAVISQGNNIEGYEFMELCVKHKIPFVTLTHLVAESKWPSVHDEKIEKFRALYDRARVNFFVSKHTLRMHEKFLGYNCTNSKVVYNPFIKNIDENLRYPPVLYGTYKIALLGRLENYHKGYDLLIDVLSMDKWKNRNIEFTIYGDGPHVHLLERLIGLNNIKNLKIEKYADDINAVWKEHHLLLMPSRLEGQSLTLIEAMNFKRAAVVTNVGGVEELIEDGITGFIAEFPSPKAIDDALENAWNKKENWEEMGIKACYSIRARYPLDAVDYFNTQLLSFLNDERHKQ